MYLLKIAFTPKGTTKETLIDKIGPLTKEQFEERRDAVIAHFVKMGWRQYHRTLLQDLHHPTPATLVDDFRVAPTIRIDHLPYDPVPVEADAVVDRIEAALQVGRHDASNSHRPRR